jgi:hypothetical protein
MNGRMAAGPLELDESLLSAIAERRLALRVPVSIEIVLRDGFRKRHGELLDLSLTGCRLRFAEPVTADRRPWLWIPAGLGGRFAHPVGSEVAWTDSVSGAPTGHCQVGLRFRRFPWRGRARLLRALSALLLHASDCERLSIPEAPERRDAPRVAYDRRVIARGTGTPLVLLGRDLSAGGISVETRRALAIGDRMQIALHAGGDVPLVLSVEVVRAIDECVWALAFRDLRGEQRERIEALLRDQLTPHARGSTLLVSEVSAT